MRNKSQRKNPTIKKTLLLIQEILKSALLLKIKKKRKDSSRKFSEKKTKSKKQTIISKGLSNEAFSLFTLLKNTYDILAQEETYNLNSEHFVSLLTFRKI